MILLEPLTAVMSGAVILPRFPADPTGAVCLHACPGLESGDWTNLLDRPLVRCYPIILTKLFLISRPAATLEDRSAGSLDAHNVVERIIHLLLSWE